MASTSRAVEMTVSPPLAEVQSRFARALANLRSRGPAMQGISIFLDQWVQRNFQSQGGNVGGWAPLAPSTVRQRLRRQLRSRSARQIARGTIASGGNLRILQITGQFRQSFVPFHSAVEAGVGTQVPWAKYHDEGGVHLPQRRLLPKEPEVRDDIVGILERFARKALAALRGE